MFTVNEHATDQAGQWLLITLIKSPIGYSQRQRRTVRALGLHKVNQTVEQVDCAVVRGMVAKVRHLVDVQAIPLGSLEYFETEAPAKIEVEGVSE